MSQDPPVPRQDSRADEPAVLTWGADPGNRTDQPESRWTALARDRRLPLVLAGLGGVAAFASLAGEWSVMTVPNSGPEATETVRVPAGVSDVGNFGTAYLIGLLALAGCVALVLAGSRGARHNARVLALTLAGGLLVLLTTAALALDQAAERRLFYPADDGFRIEYGRGLMMAFVAAVLLGLAAYRADGPPVSGADGDEGPVSAGTGQTDPLPAATGTGGWRRRRAAAEPDDVPAGPADLTVEPTNPFVRPDPPAGR
ncbi:hypothetical protein [Micromonospora echinofusca]|uniref:Tryptophan-associated transmembrane protein (Trp_oprn_chp) n=1 Tax=Micromonospora echinofusca TaxID=47858 RepID=A0ABS3VU31_MICEH|nr:hypothetical protein [Micromonospora echinofusca]MBO4208032.1 hypothetical protein [Micromonospora echinofusca]